MQWCLVRGGDEGTVSGAQGNSKDLFLIKCVVQMPSYLIGSNYDSNNA